MFVRRMTLPSMLTVPVLSHFSDSGAFVFQWRSKRRAFGACIFASAKSIAERCARLLYLVDFAIRFALRAVLVVSEKRYRRKICR